MTKVGWKTTEFWLAVATDVGVVAAALAGQLSPRYAAIAASVSTFAFSLARGLTKVTPPVVAVTGTTVQQTTPIAPPAAGSSGASA